MKSMFASNRHQPPLADARNAHGAKAHGFDAEHELAQLAVTGALGGGFYQSAEAELAALLKAAEQVEPDFLAKSAIYARREAKRKDTAATLLAVLARRDPALFRDVFDRVATDAKMVRTFVQIVRSGRTGRKSLGSAPKAMVKAFLDQASDRTLLNAMVGADPSLADLIKMVHPKPISAERRALYAWIIGKPADAARLPEPVRAWLRFKERPEGKVPAMPFQMLSTLDMTRAQWTEIAERSSWQTLRQGLNMFARKGVFEDAAVTARITRKLVNRKTIARAGVLPWQLLAAAQHLSPRAPDALHRALRQAADIALENAPEIVGEVVIAPDVSGSMTWPITGYRRGQTTAMRFVDAAAMLAAAIARRNPRARIMPFDFDVRETPIDPRGPLLETAERLVRLAGGGTNVSSPIRRLNAERAKVDLVVIVSDNQSWVDAREGGRGTALMKEWLMLKRRNPKARLLCLDIAPYATSQAPAAEDIANMGGFSDATFGAIADFAAGRSGAGYWTKSIEAVAI